MQLTALVAHGIDHVLLWITISKMRHSPFFGLVFEVLQEFV